MSALFKRRQLIFLGLIVALGAAIFVNWYYTKPNIDLNNSADKAQSESTTNINNLGEAHYVNGTVSSSENDYFTEAILKRTNAYDTSVSTLKSIIEDDGVDSESKLKANEQLTALTNNINLESEIESLISARSNGKCFVCIGDTVEVVMQSGTLEETMVTQIKEIIVNKTKITGENITIIESK